MPDPDIAAARAALDDSGLVLQARTQLDALALDVLSSPGLAEVQVARMRSFLDGEWPRAAAALRRIAIDPGVGS